MIISLKFLSTQKIKYSIQFLAEILDSFILKNLDPNLSLDTDPSNALLIFP